MLYHFQWDFIDKKMLGEIEISVLMSGYFNSENFADAAKTSEGYLDEKLRECAGYPFLLKEKCMLRLQQVVQP